MNDYRDMAWPSVGRIANKCSLGERAVQNNLKAICESGYLMINGKGPQGTNRYAICTPALDAPPHLNTNTPAPDAPELTKELTNTTTTTKKRFIKPTLDEVKAYAEEKGFKVDTDYFFEFYTTAKWKDAGGKQIKNWKLKLLTWNNREKKNAATNGRTGQPIQQHKQSPGDRLRAKLAKDIADGTAV
jgi:hypothetical protein